MQPRGLGIPAILAASLAGPFGNSWYSSLTLTPEVLPRIRTVGPVPFASYSCRMNVMTCQCCAVSSPTPASLAICGAISSVHCAGSSRNPSSLTVTSWPAYVLVGISVPLPCDVLAGDRHPARHARYLPAGQQDVPVEPAEGELAEVVEPGLTQQRQPDPAREPARQRLGVVVEVDEQRLAEAALDEAVRVAVEDSVRRLSGQPPQHVADQHLALEVGHRAGLRRGQARRVADHEDVRAGLGDQRLLIARHEAELVAQPWRPAHVPGAAMKRHHHREVKGFLAAVVGDEPARS